MAWFWSPLSTQENESPTKGWDCFTYLAKKAVVTSAGLGNSSRLTAKSQTGAMYFRGISAPCAHTSSQLPCNHLLSGSLRQLQCYTGKNQLVITPAFSAALFPACRHDVPLLQPQVKCFGLTHAATLCSYCQGSQTRSLALSPSPCVAAPEVSLTNVCVI